MTMTIAALMVSSLAAFMTLSRQQGVRQGRAYAARSLRRSAFASRLTMAIGAASHLDVRIPT
jgi:hypothetical protein